MDKLDLLSDTVVEDKNRLIWLECIKNAVHSYRDFGLRNELDVNEFFNAYWYLFQARSTDTYGKLGLKEGSDNYFDIHYERAGLANHCTMSRFLGKIKDDRKELLDYNWDRVVGFVHREQAKDRKAGDRKQVTLPVISMASILLEPKEPNVLASMFYYPASRIKRRSYNKVIAERFKSFWSDMPQSVLKTPKNKTEDIKGQLNLGVIDVEKNSMVGNSNIGGSSN